MALEGKQIVIHFYLELLISQARLGSYNLRTAERPLINYGLLIYTVTQKTFL